MSASVRKISLKDWRNGVETDLRTANGNFMAMTAEIKALKSRVATLESPKCDCGKKPYEKYRRKP